MLVQKRLPRWDDPYSLVGLFFLPLLTLAALATAHLPATLLPRCHFKRLTSVPCPTCGAWRALCLLNRGDLPGALRSQPLLVGAGMALAVVAVYALLTAVLQRPRHYVRFSRRERQALWLVAALAMLANWAFLVIDGR